MTEAKVDVIADVFRQRLLEGEYGTRGRLPSLRLLSKEFDTTNETMNKVIQLLQAEGLLVSRGRAGVFVNSVRTRIPGITSRFDLYLQEQGLTPMEENIEAPGIVPAPEYVAKALGIEPGSEVVRRIRLQGGDDIPFRIAENYYPVTLAGGTVLQWLQSNKYLDVLDAIKGAHGKYVKSISEDVIGRLPTTGEADLLKIVRGAPVLEVQRKSYAQDDKTVIMFNKIVFVASYFVLTYDYTAQHWG
ncbi:GntR family transcriptional regulator [Ktedonobacter robiniae]|uniref:HTH gntR-type domain-containing protein n=1 Tax=Ktedonobacter robiniae TaxID=2778365 RepID=A0ABQ3UKH0_9CHLR|nr:GntR family transcriptional regulator [Ktedonobacter robiniae]GHO52887.1 hypothetical protein KSB_13620 [Ktedonobacter robiniae]